MLKELIEFLMEQKSPDQIVVKDRVYYDSAYTPANDPYPECMDVNNLTGIVDFIKQKPEEWEDLFIHVIDYNCVRLYQSKNGDFNQRVSILKGSSRPCNFNFGRHMDIEDFIIAVNGMFIKTDDRDYALKFVSKIKVDANSKIEDDGISQTVTARVGSSSLVSDLDIQPILKLQPFRTFNEIDQPESDFVFRMKLSDNKPYCSLHECDGEAWKQTAIQSIKDYFKKQEINIPVIA